MAAVEVTISGVLYDKYNRTQQNVVLIGEASLTGLSIGGGPIVPPSQPGKPPIIWGGPIDPYPDIGFPVPQPPPPSLPTPPQPGDPTKPLPPPAGNAGWPIQPIVPPPFIVVNYPGIGPVVVAPPAPSGPTSSPPAPSAAPKP